MEKFFLKVLHEEPVTDLSLQELVGGITFVCGQPMSLCPCNNGSLVECPNNCGSDCPEDYEPCVTDGCKTLGGFGSDIIKPIKP